ncbi:MAG: helix-turn-helix domain-containing protein [Pseudonocardiaceae bacterium]
MDTRRREQFGGELRQLRERAGISLSELATRVHVHRGYLGHIEQGERWPSRRIVEALDSALNARRMLLDTWSAVEASRSSLARATADPVDPGELEAVELARRVAASDVGAETLARLEAAVDDLATAYPVTAPDELLDRVRVHLGYVSRLTDARATLDERHRLLVVGGWLALLAATLHIDLEQRRPARSWLDTATGLAEQTGHAEIHAWRYETEAWQVLTDGDYRRAVELSQTAQQIAPRGSSAAIQATAQEGRAWARLGETRDTYDAINRVHKLAAPLPRPDRPEHHYRYDPTKAVAYTATTLAWVGDRAAENYAREIIARLHRNGDSGRWPRRVAAANIDLALALLTTDHLDEAAARTLAAMNSGMVVPSNHWRALEVVHAIENRQLPEGRDLRDAYEQMRRTAR